MAQNNNVDQNNPFRPVDINKFFIARENKTKTQDVEKITKADEKNMYVDNGVIKKNNIQDKKEVYKSNQLYTQGHGIIKDQKIYDNIVSRLHNHKYTELYERQYVTLFEKEKLIEKQKLEEERLKSEEEYFNDFDGVEYINDNFSYDEYEDAFYEEDKKKKKGILDNLALLYALYEDGSL